MKIGPRGWRIFRAVFGLVGIAFLVLAFRAAWDDSLVAAMPSVPAIAAAGAVVGLALVTAALGWVALFEGAGSPRRLAHGLYVAQFGKHIPGGIWHALGQIGLAVGPGVTPARAAVVYPVQAVVQIASAAAVGALVVFAGAAPGWLRGVALAGLLALPLLHRRWMSAAAERIRRWRGLRQPIEHLPSQATILRCFAWDVATLVLSGLGFALLLRSVVPGTSLFGATVTFSLAWVVGFLALPFPAGVGVREAVMLAALGAEAPLVIAASITHRLVTMAGEAVGAAATWRSR